MLNPSMDIYILVHAQVKYQVEKMRQGKITSKFTFMYYCCVATMFLNWLPNDFVFDSALNLKVWRDSVPGWP